jgi:superfamily II DNA/RNA helicase
MVTIEGLDFSNVRTTAGDLNGADLAAVMEAEKNLQGIAAASIEVIGDRRTLVFTAGVKQAEMLCEIFNRHKPEMAGWVCGATPKPERRDLLNRFSDGRTQVVVNCNCLSEGFDNPGVEVVIQARPTKSRSLYAQQCGRSTRPLAGIVDGLTTAAERKMAIAMSDKKSALIVDFVGNAGRHKLMTTADILGGKVSDEAIARATANVKARGQAIRMDTELEEAERDIRREIEVRKKREAARRTRLVAKAKFSIRTISPFDAFQLEPARVRGWDTGRQLSEKQRALLLRQGINPEGMPYAQAKQLLSELFRRWDSNLATLKQCILLKRYGYETKNVTMEQASKLIDQLARNNWRRPDEEQAA